MSESPLPRWKRHLYELIAAEVSALTRYYDRVVQWRATPGDDGQLLELIDCRDKRRAVSASELDAAIDPEHRNAVLLNATLNHDLDIQSTLGELRRLVARTTRVVAVTFNPYLHGLYEIAHRLGMKTGEMPTTFLTLADIDALCRLTGYERVRVRPAVYVPWRLFGLGTLCNKLLPAVPLLRHLALANVIVLRPLAASLATRPLLSIVIPARNEKGNIENAVRRLPELPVDVEVIFVEGHSTDGTWEEIQRVRDAYADRVRISAYQQQGRGKADAVRLGFAHARGDLLTILDADLTMPPELLPRFVDAYLSGAADFINGSRILYPMEGEAMRFLNRIGNVFFAKLLTHILGVRLTDALCGTKLLRRDDYARMTAWRAHFGDFDPFGDFELLFPAAVLGLGMVDVPIRYRARTYGETNISRFRHGWMLLKMTVIGFLRLKLGVIPRRR